MTNYDRGAYFERQVAGHLRRDGYLVMRAAGSHGEADLVALKPGEVLLIQVKSNGYLLPAEWQQLLDTAVSVAAVPLLAHRPGPGRIVYWRLLGPKQRTGSGHYEVWTADEVMAGG